MSCSPMSSSLTAKHSGRLPATAASRLGEQERAAGGPEARNGLQGRRGRDDPRGCGALLHHLEESQCLWTVADQQVLGLRVVLEHHLMRLATDTRDLVAAERG